MKPLLNKSKDLLHPLIGNHITKANFIGEIPELVREKAIMTQGSSEYFESGSNESHVNEYLNKNLPGPIDEVSYKQNIK